MVTKIKHVARRVKQVWAELDYAQRRLFELRTGVPARRDERPKISRSIDELDRLYAA